MRTGAAEERGGGAGAGPGAVLTGPEFRARVLRADGSVDREAFRALWPALRVMGRCSPQDKYTIVRGARARPPRPYVWGALLGWGPGAVPPAAP